jgi:hypothetical protein
VEREGRKNEKDVIAMKKDNKIAIEKPFTIEITK